MLQQAPTSHQLESFLQMQLHSLMLATSRGWQRPTVGSHQSDCCLSNGLKVRGISARCSAAPTTATAPFARLPGGPSSARCSSTSPICLVIDTDGEEKLGSTNMKAHVDEYPLPCLVLPNACGRLLLI
ncbi:unnamed protein product [Musa acuminata subsp. burmannicoides]